MATEQPSPQPDDVGDRVIDDVRKAARHLEELLPEVKRYISSDVLRALQHGLSQLRLLGPAGRRGAADDQPMRHLRGDLGFRARTGVKSLGYPLNAAGFIEECDQPGQPQSPSS